MAPEQNDYGKHGDSTLVPGALTVFRHFQADIRSGVLMPMNYNPKRVFSFHGMHAPGQAPYRPGMGDRVYQAECSRRQPAFLMDDPVAAHKSPSVDCSCGFYASYDPATDFYPSFRWGLEYARLAGMDEIADVVVVKAAVEVSGTVVMGRLGVRAEKMKIVGISVDWGKQIKQSARRAAAYWSDANPWDSMTRVAFYDDYAGEYRVRYDDGDTDEDAKVIAGAHRIAEKYGAEYYGNADELIKAHPKADIEALGVDTTPPPREYWDAPDGFWYVNGGNLAPIHVSAQQARQLATQMQSYARGLAQSVTPAIQGAAAAFALFDEATQGKSKQKKRKKQPKVRMGDPKFVDALEAKRNRPAPPGTGIDRRRGRLR